MLTVEENDLLTKIDNDAPMAELMRQHWTPVCLIEEVAEPDGTPLASRGVRPQLRAASAIPRVAWVCWTSCARIGKPRWFLGGTKIAGCAASITAGSSTSTATASPCRRSPTHRPLHGKVKHRAYPVREWGGFVWAWLDTEREAPEFEPPAFRADRGHADRDSQDPHSRPTGRRSPKARSIRRIHRRCIPPTWCQRGSKVRRRMRSPGIAPRPTSRRACRRRPRPTGSTTRRSANRSRTRRRIITCASPSMSRPSHRLIPPNNAYNVATVIVPISDEESLFPLHRLGGPRHCPSTEFWRKFTFARPGIDLGRQVAPPAHAGQRFHAGSQPDEAGQFQRHRGHPEPGHRDVGLDGGTSVDRSTDILGASDLAIVEFRRLMSDAARRVAEGGAAIGTEEPRVPPRVDFLEGRRLFQGC